MEFNPLVPKKKKHNLPFHDIPIPERLINRELSWLRFNMRVMEESNNLAHPLLERLRFLSISGSNLDEFYMVRVAGIRGQITAGVEKISNDGLTPLEQLKKINDLAEDLINEQQVRWAALVEELRSEGISLIESGDITAKDMDWLEEYFLESVFPILTPLAVDPAHPFPFIPNLGFSIVLELENNEDGSPLLALLPVPRQTKRFVRLPGADVRFISVENCIRLFLNLLFPNYSIKGEGIFRLIRDSEMEVDEEAEDLVRVFESALKRRRRGHVIRLEVNANIPENLLKMVKRELQITDTEIISVSGVLGLAEVDQLIVDGFSSLKFKALDPRFPQRVKEKGGNCFSAIREKDFIVHHPFESFDVVVSFLRQAALDPDVVAIKQTLYRTSEDSPIVRALIDAAEAGKSVTALVELKARFDEARNIKWARDMERAGVQVVYGFLELKTHAKISVIVRRENEHLRTYIHYGTGNYHSVTAKIYTDLSFFTDDEALGRDAIHIFNYLTGYARPKALEKVVISPFGIRDKLIELIEREMDFAKKGKPASLWAKMNALVDPIIIDKLYEASCAGVSIDLIVRGICCLRPGVPDMSENIRVKSIVGRFLEHARITCFGNGHPMPSDHAKVYISSSDWMPRNFERRVEALIPIENSTVKSQVLGQVMVANLKDNMQSWHLQPDHSYVRAQPGKVKFSAHDYFLKNPSLSGMGKAIKGKEFPLLLKE
ncbi:Polyphosphate kinase [hydrothermal vent metagenome]|uniref:ATP-polyphosphate phosphotransferase n=1 Tax=hydrothermal vent metagenome TaxID=652676 RepID=A0A3B0RVP0_9ZZZZ